MLGTGRGEERKGCEESAPLTLSSECLSHIGQAEAICCAVPAPWMNRGLHFAYVSAALLFSLLQLAKPFLKHCRNIYLSIPQATAFFFSLFFSFFLKIIFLFCVSLHAVVPVHPSNTPAISSGAVGYF